MELNFELLQSALMSILLGLVTVLAYPLFKHISTVLHEQAVQVRAKLSNDAVFVLDNISRIVVAAIEQEQVKGLIDKTKSELKTEAIRRVQNWLNSIGLNGISAEVISDAIEAALRSGSHKDIPSVEAEFEILEE